MPEGDILPVTYPWMMIDRAWALANGDNVRVGVLDTGTDWYQYELSMGYNSGAVPSRFFLLGGQDQTSGLGCSHGTRIAGVIVAPKNGSNIAGVAWGADLLSFRFGGDHIDPNADEVTNGLRWVGDNGANVIQMAFGFAFTHTNIRDEILRQYSLGRTLVAAAGTFSCPLSSNNILWPAEKSEVIAVSAVQYDGTRPCAAAYGPELDVVAYHGNPTTGRSLHGTTPVSIEQSSNASAIVSGVVALMLQRMPGLTPAEVRTRLMNSANCMRPGAPGSWRLMVNAEAAVGGICVLGYPASGPDVVEFFDGDPRPRP